MSYSFLTTKTISFFGALWICSIGGLGPQVYANEIHKFSVRPRLCVLSEDEALCKDKLKISWQSMALQDICLFRSGSSEPLQCWQGKSKGQLKFNLSTDRDVEFELRLKGTDVVLAKETFMLTRSDKKYRRARRNSRFKRKPWVFF